ncbi:MAG: asparagine synthase (glutamine-hydrolyzing) [Elusimicrobia bacterium]|nr:asparagine synthase (glutamine-hydrolyzing) [Elusimicrobiota bacterium]
MCGICGVVSLDASPVDPGVVRTMRESLAHRGPDDSGEYFEEGVGLGFRRLSILDVEKGHQPMQTEDGSLALVYNGEVYNHPLLRTRLESMGCRFHTQCDTETVLRLFQKKGRQALNLLHGMFALGLWDISRRELLLARDPVGIKPLYYTSFQGKLYFASELRALLKCGVPVQLDPVGLWDYLSFGYVHSPKTILQGVLKLPPGHSLTVNRSGLNFEKYWEVAVSDGQRSSRDSWGSVLEELESILQESVRSQMISDVPLGAFLSGGIDSSLIVALMSRVSSRPIQTFTIGFSGSRLDESGYAKEVARVLKTEHHAVILPADVLNQVEKLLSCLDEPIADSAILPTHLLAKFSREKVKVVLTGEGADELFAGYGRYKSAYVTRRLEGYPRWVFSLGSKLLGQKLPVGTLQEWLEVAQHSSVPSQKQYLTAFCREVLSREAREVEGWVRELDFLKGFNGILAFDFKTVLADCLLMKVDKSTMGASLEARVPYLDKSVVEFAFRLSPELKIRLFRGKWILRRLAEKFLPRSITRRRKHGFWVPWEEWIRNPRNPSVDAVFQDSILKDQELFDVPRLQADLRDLRRGSRRVDSGLFFRVAILGLWLQNIKRQCLL